MALYGRRAFQRGGGAKGAPSLRGAPKFAKKIFGTFSDINNGMRKNFLNLNFTDIGQKKGFYPCFTRNLFN
jgi:hypothetical protein